MEQQDPTLVQCRVCNQDVASTAPTCPNCGVVEPYKTETCKECRETITAGLQICPYCEAQDPSTPNSVTLVGGLVVFALFICLTIWMTSNNKTSTGSTSSATTQNRSVERKWYEGGTQHHALVTKWRMASRRDKLATCADWCATVDNSVNFEVLKLRAGMLLICMDEAVSGGDADSMWSYDVATGCIMLLRDSW